MAKTKSGMTLVLAPAARRDIKDIALWSEAKFGKDAELRYEALLVQALRDIESNPARPGVNRRPDLAANISPYPLAPNRSSMASETVKEPRHFLAFRASASRLEIIRVLHDSRDLARHLPSR